MKILHLADIHYSKLAERTIDDFFTKLQALTKPDVCVIAGDLFDSSVFFDDAASSGVLDFITKLYEIVDTDILIVRGTPSHDRDNLNTLKTVFKKNTKIRIFTAPVEWKDFCCVPEPNISNSKQSIQLLSQTQLPYVVFHGSIESSVLPMGLTIESVSKVFLKKALFKKFKLGCCGHIHIAQQLKNTTCYYSGSLGRFAFGEEHPKGFYYHNLADKTHDFIQVDSPPYETYEFDNEDGVKDFLETCNKEDPVRVILTKPRQQQLEIPSNIKIEVRVDKKSVTEDTELQRLAGIEGMPLADKTLAYMRDKMKLTVTDELEAELRLLFEEAGVS